MKKILMILAPDNFRDIEYIVPRAFWEQQGAKVQTASTDIQSLGRFGYKVTNDMLVSDAKAEDFDAIFFVGGGGSLVFTDNEDAKQLTHEFIDAGKVVSAICAAPRNFLAWGILSEKQATGHNWDGQFPELCEQHGAEFVDKDVVVDGKFITANGPEAAEALALAVIEQL